MKHMEMKRTKHCEMTLPKRNNLQNVKPEKEQRKKGKSGKGNQTNEDSEKQTTEKGHFWKGKP